MVWRRRRRRWQSESSAGRRPLDASELVRMRAGMRSGRGGPMRIDLHRLHAHLHLSPMMSSLRLCLLMSLPTPLSFPLLFRRELALPLRRVSLRRRVLLRLPRRPPLSLPLRLLRLPLISLAFPSPITSNIHHLLFLSTAPPPSLSLSRSAMHPRRRRRPILMPMHPPDTDQRLRRRLIAHPHHRLSMPSHHLHRTSHAHSHSHHHPRRSERS